MNFYVGKYKFCINKQELLYEGVSQKIEPQVFKLLVFMLENPDRVLSRDELVKQIWKSNVISDSAISAAISAARRAIGDTGYKQEYIKTVSGSGYRFIAKFSCEKIQVKPHPETNLPISKVLEPIDLPDKPSIAVMDFLNIGGEKRGDLFAFGITTEINAYLARISHFFVIARASSANVSKKGLLPQEIHHCLGVRYLIYGNIQYLPQRLRLTLSIVNASENSEIWSEHFDRSLEDIIQIQDEIALSIVVAIDSAIEHAEIERAFHSPSKNLSAWENYYRGIWHMRKTRSRDTKLANKFFKKSISLMPRFSRAYAGLSYIHTNQVLLNNSPAQYKENIFKALDYAQRSIDYDKREGTGYGALARVQWLSGDKEKAINACDKGLSFNTNSTQCYGLKGIISAYIGNNIQSQKCFEYLKKINPFTPEIFSFHTAQAITLVHQKRYKQAVDIIVLAVNESNAYFITYAVASACFQLAKLPSQAKQYAQKTLQLHPNYSVESHLHLISHSNKMTKEILKNAMLNAGLPLSNSLNKLSFYR